MRYQVSFALQMSDDAVFPIRRERAVADAASESARAAIVDDVAAKRRLFLVDSTAFRAFEWWT